MNVAGWVELVVVLDVQTVSPEISAVDKRLPAFRHHARRPYLARTALLVVADDLGDFGLKNNTKITRKLLCKVVYIWDFFASSAAVHRPAHRARQPASASSTAMGYHLGHQRRAVRVVVRISNAHAAALPRDIPGRLRSGSVDSGQMPAVAAYLGNPSWKGAGVGRSRRHRSFGTCLSSAAVRFLRVLSGLPWRGDRPPVNQQPKYDFFTPSHKVNQWVQRPLRSVISRRFGKFLPCQRSTLIRRRASICHMSSNNSLHRVLLNPAPTQAHSSKHKASDVIRILDNEPDFDATEWIGTGRVFQDIPSYVADAYRAVREIPQTLSRKLPNQDLSVTDLLAITLPRILTNDMAFPRRTLSWFSAEKPNCESDTVWSSVVPPLWFLRDLESALPQAWLNGVQSVVDPNNPNHRLPLRSIRFYREITDLHDAQEQWQQSKYWLPNAEHFILDRVGWNSVRDGAFDGQLGWARVIDDEWLSGDNIDNIMHHIKACTSKDPALKFAAPSRILTRKFNLSLTIVPDVQFRGVTSINLMHIGSWVMMRTARRLYLGKVLGIYRYGSVSGKHESFTDAETVQGLSYLSLEVYEQTNLGRNFFQHTSFTHPSAAGRDGLALFTHAPISELVYLLSGASIGVSGAEGLYSLNSGENGWELWNRVCHEELLKVLKVPVEPGVGYAYNADDYEKPVEGSKKRRAKPPRGATKKQKVTREQEKPQRKKKVVSDSAASRMATVKRLRGVQKGAGAKKAKK
ncbi:hypothetical protein GGX14DRAFT_606725 [Mycena pura]|uniref:Uncharacterized protein n=1 Tax=Mycena pura TaxID=153505 RepID=A0AAD6YJK7_9AGAR|nr:hypothetical protein GGX14DRAFT_606725 [Mycena pura]